jgi:hypothetical protein
MLASFVEARVRAGRERRFALFVDLVRSARGTDGCLRILDVGGTSEYWEGVNWKALGSIEVTLLNLMPQKVEPPFAAAVGDARDLSAFADQSFDVVYSNSVISLVGARQEQARMAREIQRVGRAYVLQTPNYNFPIDWRTLVPLFHFLPVTMQAWCFRHLRVGRYPRMESRERSLLHAGRVRDLTLRELTDLFPGCRVARERVAGFTKSFIVYKGF